MRYIIYFGIFPESLSAKQREMSKFNVLWKINRILTPLLPIQILNGLAVLGTLRDEIIAKQNKET